MKIEKESCVGCVVCVSYCTMGAISLLDNVAVIDQDECVDCRVCLRSKVCPVDAFVYEPASWPRSLRAVLSDPRIVSNDTGVPGRGTEEMKTNEVTGVFKRGWVGFGLEFGRPGIGTRFRDVDKVAQVMAKQGAQFRHENPVTFLMKDINTGRIKEEVLGEKVLSAILEFVLPIEKVKDALVALKDVSEDVDTVFSVACINVVEPDGSLPMEKILSELGIPRYINGKTNVGLGRPLAEGGNR